MSDFIPTTIEEKDARAPKEAPLACKMPSGEVLPGRCTARRASGVPCGNYACHKRGLTLCSRHGGMKPRGIQSPSFVTGRYSKVLPKKLAERAEAAERDPDLLSSRADVALLHARLEELCSQIDSGESATLWADLQQQVHRLDMATTDEERLAVSRAMKGIIEKGSNNEAVWSQIHFTLDHKTKTASAEWKRLVDMQHVITTERAVALMTRITDAVLRHVPEPERRSSIAREMKTIMNLGGPDLVPDNDREQARHL